MLHDNIFNFATLKNLKVIEDSDGTLMLDIFDPTIEYRVDVRYSNNSFIVTSKYEGRPDLVSKLLYGTEDYMDLLMFYNDIPHAFMLQEGTILRVPNISDIRQNLKDNNQSTDRNITRKNLNKKLPQKDKNRIQAITGEAEVRTPVIAKEGTTPVKVVDGRIILGTGISDKRCSTGLTGTQKRTELIRQAVKDKLSAV